MLPGMPDLSHIVLQAQRMQAEMERAQADLASAEVTGTAGGGLVSAVVGGDGELKQVRIDPSVADPADVETLGDLVVAAVRDAQRQVAELSSRTMGSVTGGLTDALSGFGLPGLGAPFGGGYVESAPGVVTAEADEDDDDELDDEDELDDDELVVVEPDEDELVVVEPDDDELAAAELIKKPDDASPGPIPPGQG